MQIIKLTEDEMLGERPNLPIMKGATLAGGAVRSWFAGDEKVNDYDLFFESDQHLEQYINEHLQNAKKTRDEKFLLEFELDNKKIQLIKRIFPKNINELFDRFDFHLCQFALTNDGIFSTKKALLSVLRKRLSYNNNANGFEVDTLRRAFKYSHRGYFPCVGCLADLGKSFKNVENIDEQIEFYSDEKSKRTVRFD